MDAVEYRSLGQHGYPGYEVGSDGTIWTVRAGERKQLRPATNATSAVRQVVLQTAGGSKTRVVARLILLAFGSPPPDGRNSEPRYLDGDHGNCAPSNLEWQPRAQRPRRPAAQPSVHPVRTAIKQAVQLRRAALDLRIVECAERAGLSREQWHRAEFGMTSMSVETLLRVCRALECTPNDLLPPGWQEMILVAG